MKSCSFESPEPHLLGLTLKKKHSTTFKICQDVLKSANLLHKRGLDDFQSHTTVKLIFRYNVEWIGREGLAPETHEEYLNDFINHFYKNVLKLVDRAMRKEDTSPQGKIYGSIQGWRHLRSLVGPAPLLFGPTGGKSMLRPSRILGKNGPNIERPREPIY